MRRALLLASSFVLALAMATPALAQQAATFVLRSGERLSCELVDMGGAGFQVRVGGASRQIPTGDVAVIDFSGSTSFPDNEVNQIQSGKHLIVLSSGQVVSGNLYDVGGTQPKRISVHTDTVTGTSGRTRSGASTSRARAARAPRLPLPPTQGLPSMLPASGGQIRVPGNQRWTDTGITVRRGERVTFNASGQVQLSSNGSDTAGPAGATSGRRPSGPMPQVLAGALIGRVGPVGLFAIGNQTTPLTMPADGRLFLGVNDDEVNDNRGEFTVDVRPDTSTNRR